MYGGACHSLAGDAAAVDGIHDDRVHLRAKREVGMLG